MLYLQRFYSTAQTLTSDISISTKIDMYHYKIDTTCVGHHNTKTHINNVNKTQTLPQTTGGKDEPNIV